MNGDEHRDVRIRIGWFEQSHLNVGRKERFEIGRFEQHHRIGRFVRESSLLQRHDQVRPEFGGEFKTGQPVGGFERLHQRLEVGLHGFWIVRTLERHGVVEIWKRIIRCEHRPEATNIDDVAIQRDRRVVGILEHFQQR